VLKELPSDRQTAVVHAILDYAATANLHEDVAEFEFGWVQ
jgi:hypothetical protein